MVKFNDNELVFKERFTMKRTKKVTAFILCAVLVISSCMLVNGAESTVENTESVEDVVESVDAFDLEDLDDDGGFFSYYTKYSEMEYPDSEITLNIDTLENMTRIEADGRQALRMDEGDSVSFSVTVEDAGAYEILVDYYCTADASGDSIFSFMVDGELPYTEAGNFMLARIWKDDLEGDEFGVDTLGNDIRPSQVLKETWVSTYLYDARGLYDTPFFVYLEEGVHTIEVTCAERSMVLGGISLKNREALISYSDYISQYTKSYEGDAIIWQAEHTYDKNNSVLYPTYDHSNSATQPQNPKVVKLNTIGQSNWNGMNDSISWKPNIPEVGLYKIVFRARQNYSQGMYSYRTLKVNGEIPFAEAEQIGFGYDNSWYVKTFGGEEAYLVWLEPGDVVSLTATTGDMSELIREINRLTLEFNKLYRDVISITSNSPDIYRDYMLSSYFPELEQDLANLADELELLSDKFYEITQDEGSSVSILTYITSILREFSEDCNFIPERLTTFQGALEDLGTLVTTVGEQPLELDYIMFAALHEKAPKADNNWFKQAIFTLKAFFASFSEDYNSVGSSEDEAIEVWVTTGRDQAKAINTLIRNEFTAKTGIKVNVSVVSLGTTLIKASLAGEGPDVALLAGVPMELAARNALVELTPYGVEELKGNYNETIWNAMSYNHGVYALPETMNFKVMFYRQDILEDLDLAIPETWEEFYHVMEVLQKNNYTVGLPELNAANYGVSSGIPLFASMLLQNGGEFYNELLTEVEFDTEVAFDTFEKWVELYRTYGISREYSFYNRFRTGDMPIGIEMYATYSSIAAAAPEIEGLWTIAPIPGTAKEDGNIDRTQYVGEVSGCYMLKSAVEKGIDKEAYELMKWWTSVETQTSYAKELEATLGIAGRYTPASKEVLNSIGWSSSELEVMNATMDSCYVIEKVPGDVLLQRSITTAFRNAYEDVYSPRYALSVANREINNELLRKRIEFGMETEEE